MYILYVCIHEGKSGIDNRNFIITCFTRVLTEIVCVLFFDTVPPASQHTRSSCPQACGWPPEKKLFGVAFNQLSTASITSSSSANLWPRKCSFLGPNKWKSNCLHTEPSFFCRFQTVSHPLTTKNEYSFVAFPRCQLTVERPHCMGYCACSDCSIITTPIWHVAKKPFCVSK